VTTSVKTRPTGGLERHPQCLERVLGTLILVLVVLCTCTSSFGQDNGQAEDRDFNLRVPVELVLIPVTVEGEDGKLVNGLQKENFEIREQGVPQNINFFSVDPFPLSVAVLIDTSTDAHTQTNLGETTLTLVESFSSFDEVALFQFENTVDKLQDFTFNKDEILKAFGKMSLKGSRPAISGGPFSNDTMISGIPIETGRGKTPPPKTLNTHIDDAIFAASLELRTRSKDRRKVIIVISNGQNAPGNRNSSESTLESLLRSEIVVYGIGQGTGLLYRKNTLSKYADFTGGAVFYPVKASGYSETYQKIAQMARNQYVLGFVPKVDVEKVSYRQIEVRTKAVDFKIAKIRSRKGYYAIPRP
jgi:VWFA-related protein